MANTVLLKKIINDRGKTIADLAKTMNLSREGLHKKLRQEGATEFKESEINTLINELKLSSSERDLIFFTNQSEYYSLN